MIVRTAHLNRHAEKHTTHRGASKQTGGEMDEAGLCGRGRKLRVCSAPADRESHIRLQDISPKLLDSRVPWMRRAPSMMLFTQKPL